MKFSDKRNRLFYYAASRNGKYRFNNYMVFADNGLDALDKADGECKHHGLTLHNVRNYRID
jgi:hypothetical protein